MSRRALLACGASLLIPGAGRADSLSNGDFRIEVLGVLRSIRPQARIVPDPDPLQIKADTFTIFLGNLHARAAALPPAERRKLIESYLADIFAGAGSAPRKETAGFTEAKGRLRLQVASKDALSQVGTLVHRPLSERLIVTYVLDEPNRYQYVTQPMLAAWDIGAAEIEETAMANLEALSKKTAFSMVVAEDVPVLALVATGDGYDAARLLLPAFHARMREAFKTDALTLAAPTRDMLMAWPADSVARQTLAAEVRTQMKTGPYGRSDELFRSDKAGLRPLAPRELAEHGR